MVSMERVQSGVAKFIDRDIAPSLSGWDKVVIGGGGALLVSKLPTMAAQFAQKPVIAAMDIYDPNTGNVDVDALYEAARPYMGTDTMPVKIPMMGITMRIGKKDIDNLISYIKEGNYD